MRQNWPWPDNLLNRMEPQPDGCIYFTGALNADGYGHLRINGKDARAHRASYELHVGPIPEGYELDHTCHDPERCRVPPCPHRRCVNWEHLQPVSRQTNHQRSGAGMRNADKTHCPRGHPYDDENTYRTPEGRRQCRRCKKDRYHETKELRP